MTYNVFGETLNFVLSLSLSSYYWDQTVGKKYLRRTLETKPKSEFSYI